MTEKKATGFEDSLERLEAIVKLLESDEVTLEQSVDLFKEGRELARRCEAMLASAQQSIETAVNGTGAAGGERPAATASAPGSLFDDDALA
jgi:exodeoxyribonuclease VII small subunit